MSAPVTLAAVARTPAELTTEIATEHEAAQSAFRSAVEHAIRCGELLIEAKAQLPHGGWGEWIAGNFPASDRTARGYMRLARYGEEVNRQGLADLGIEVALKQLAAPKAPEFHWALDLIPPMNAEERAGLHASVDERGCMVPIVFDEDGILLDGRERLRACCELGIKPPSITYPGLTETEKAEYVYSLNLIRGGEERLSEQRITDHCEARLQEAGENPVAVGALVSDLDRLAPVAERVRLKALRRYGELLEAAK